MANPYEAPRAAYQAPVVTGGELPAEASYELEPADAAALTRARMGNSWLTVIFLGLIVVWNLVQGARLGIGLFIPLFIATLMVLSPWLAARATARLPLAQRRLRLQFTHEQLVVADEAGSETRVAWSGFKGRRPGKAHLFLELPSGAAHVLPRRAWANDAEFDKVRAFIEPRVAEVKRSKFGRYALILWFILIAIFVAFWSFMSDVPRNRPPATQGVTPQ